MPTKIEKVVTQFIEKTVANKEGVVYPTVREKNRPLMDEFLNKFYQAYSSLFQTHEDAEKVFCDRLMQIDAVRIDTFDENLMPMKQAYDKIKQNNNGKLQGGIFMSIEEVGVVLLDMDFLNLSTEEAVHTLIHELVHALTLIVNYDNNEKVFIHGIKAKGNNALEKLNEGITEIIAQKIWNKLLPNTKCPGIGRYQIAVDSTKLIMEQFDSEEQFIEDYLKNPNSIVEQMQYMKNLDNESLYDLIKSINIDELLIDKNKEEIVLKIKEFKNSNNIEI